MSNIKVEDLDGDMPSAAVSTLRALVERDGELTAESVLREARRKTSPIHSYFEWDDTEAANQYRLEQARRLIRRVRVTIFDTPVREFTFVPSTGSYKPTEEVMSTPDYRDEVIRRFRADARAFELKWRNNKHVAEEFRRWATEVADGALI